MLKGGELEERAIFWHYPLYMSGVDEGKVWPVHGTNQPFWRGVPSSMICRGDWKLIEFFEDDSIALFNITKDPGESRELSKDHPEIAQKLRAELEAWQKETKAVIPDQLNPEFGKVKSGGKRKKNK